MADPDQFENEEFETSAAPRARTSSIATMGQLLLQGYAMLADSCETCGVSIHFSILLRKHRRRRQSTALLIPASLSIHPGPLDA
jgi:hypothetical protein